MDTPKFIKVTLPDANAHQLKDPTLLPTPISVPTGEAIALKAGPLNTGTVFVGHDAGLTAANGYPLARGEALDMDINNGPNKLWLIGTAADVVHVAVITP